MTQLHDEPDFVFTQSQHRQGWFHLRVFEHRGNLVAVCSYKVTADGGYDDGPNNEYLYSLTNGIEAAATAVRAWLGQPFSHLVEHYPTRGRYMPMQEEFALIRLAWDARGSCYRAIEDTHPWQFVERAQVEALIGQAFPD